MALGAPRRAAVAPPARGGNVSHHSQAVIELVLGDLAVGEDGEGWEEACRGLSLSHMGRGPAKDPAFFAAAYAAGRLARQALESARP